MRQMQSVSIMVRAHFFVVKMFRAQDFPNLVFLYLIQERRILNNIATSSSTKNLVKLLVMFVEIVELSSAGPTIYLISNSIMFICLKKLVKRSDSRLYHLSKILSNYRFEANYIFN